MLVYKAQSIREIDCKITKRETDDGRIVKKTSNLSGCVAAATCNRSSRSIIKDKRKYTLQFV